MTDWLRVYGVDAVGYTGGTDEDERLEVEARLDAHQVKVVVATSALGMGYDNPELPFVIHFQSPGSAIAYYQQVGRAGRALDRAHGVLLSGREDTDIQDYFIETAFPLQRDAQAILGALESADDGMRLRDVEASVNVRRSRIQGALKLLSVEGAVAKDGGRWFRTANPWTYDAERVATVTRQRRTEQAAMAAYLESTECLMQYLRHQLDDREADRCGRCANCVGPALPSQASGPRIEEALRFLRRVHYEIEPRKLLPTGGRIPSERQLQPGKALARWGDPGWGEMVRNGKYETGHFADELVAAMADMIRAWAPQPRPEWLTYVPSIRHPELVPDLAARLGRALDVPVLPLVTQRRAHERQRGMENSSQQYRNVCDVFVVKGRPPPTPGLLLDDVVDSRWTLTTIGVSLTESGSGPVYPIALALAATS